jgi:selenocysteine lyase/cysteine desulfurase
VLWADLPDRQEAGSPNVVGAVALGTACRALADADMASLHEREEALVRRALNGLAAVGGVETYRLWPEHHDRVGVLTFNLHGTDHALLAQILSAEYGIAVRHGCFCAHPLMWRLLRVSEACATETRMHLRDGTAARLPGAVRASVGIGTTPDDIDALVDALAAIAESGPAWRYVKRPGAHDEYRPSPDPRPTPDLPFDLAGHE